MTDYTIEAKIRTENGKKTRQVGLVPAVVYGNDIENISIALDKFKFTNLYKEAGSSNLIGLAVDGQKGVKTLVHDVQLDPVTSGIIHADLLRVNMKEKLQTEIPLNFINESPAVVNMEGSLITSKDAVEVECLPGDLIPEIDVDLSAIVNFDTNIRVADLRVPAGVKILDDPEEIIAYVEPPRDEADLEALDTEVVEDVSKVEVEAEKKEEEGEEGTGETAEKKEEK